MVGKAGVAVTLLSLGIVGISYIVTFTVGVSLSFLGVLELRGVS